MNVRHLAALALALASVGSAPARAAEPWLRAGFGASVRAAQVGFGDGTGVRLEGGGRWLVLAAAYTGPGMESRPADRDHTFTLGAGARLRPFAWASLEALGSIGADHYRTMDVNLRGWYGPSHWVRQLGLRVQATVGPRYLLEGLPVFRTWSPVFYAAHAWTWSRPDEDRFRSWGGDSRWLELGVGIEVMGL